MLLSSIQTFHDYAASFEGQEPSSENNIKMYILVNGAVKLGRGKIASQVGHAVQKTTQRCVGSDKWSQYIHSRCPKIVLKVPTEEIFNDILEQTRHLTKSYVVDEGRTQCAPNTVTAVGYDPLFDSEKPDCFKQLKLY
mgnify:CR=1 FL=1|jgi:peptidyl-tRNA hydrolase